MIERERDENGVVSMPGANLHGADLCGMNLRAANLRYADLQSADLYRADLRGADLRYADLHGADLRGADLRCADLCGANLCGADLGGADLWRADLQGANLRDAALRQADVYHTAGGILQVAGLHPYAASLVPVCGSWLLRIGCWQGSTAELRELIDRDDGWPEATGDQITERRPLLAALVDMCDVHAAAHEADRKATEQWEGKP